MAFQAGERWGEIGHTRLAVKRGREDAAIRRKAKIKWNKNGPTSKHDEGEERGEWGESRSV